MPTEVPRGILFYSNELPDGDPSLPGTPANPPAELPKALGRVLASWRKHRYALSLVLVPILLLLLVAFAPRHDEVSGNAV